MSIANIAGGKKNIATANTRSSPAMYTRLPTALTRVHPSSTASNVARDNPEGINGACKKHLAGSTPDTDSAAAWTPAGKASPAYTLAIVALTAAAHAGTFGMA
jgi:hypothetical protein